MQMKKAQVFYTKIHINLTNSLVLGQRNEDSFSVIPSTAPH